MVTTVGHESDLADTLHNLIRLDYDAIEAYEAAVARFEDEQTKRKFAEFIEDHRRHITDLTPRLAGMGHEVPDGPGAKKMLTEGKIRIAGLAGDTAILTAMGTNEIETEAAYRTAAKRDDVDAELAAKLVRARDDESRHKDWMKQHAD